MAATSPEVNLIQRVSTYTRSTWHRHAVAQNIFHNNPVSPSGRKNAGASTDYRIVNGP